MLGKMAASLAKVSTTMINNQEVLMTDSMTNTQAAIADFMTRSFDGAEIEPDQDIFEAGYGNSMFAMQLVAFVESHFGLEIEADDLEIDNFRSINRVAALVARKQAMVAA